METIHVIKREDSAVVTGMEALTALYEITGMGWLFKLAKLPVLSGAAEIAYKMVSKNRTGMSNAADGLLALGRINMEEKGEGSCTDLEGECREKPPPVDEEEERAAKAAEERRAKMAAEKAEKAKAAGGAAAKTVATMAKTPPATSAGGLESAARAPKPPSSGALSDRRNILGVYDMRRSKISARALRAAPVDTSTGELIDEVITIPLDDAELSTVANALTAIVKHFGWQGNVGIGLPAVSVGTDSESVNETFDSVDMDAAIDQSFRETDIYAMEEGVAAKKLAERERNERERPDNWGKSRVRAAAKYGEMQYGDGSTSRGLCASTPLSKSEIPMVLPSVTQTVMPWLVEPSPYCISPYPVASAPVITTTSRPTAFFRYCLLYTSPSPRDATLSRMPSSA